MLEQVKTVCENGSRITIEDLSAELTPFLTKKQVLNFLHFGKSKLDYLKKGKLFPKPEKFGRKLRWLRSDIIEFV
jgi:predicted DNA-binding transcriptional regulator AlpA